MVTLNVKSKDNNYNVKLNPWILFILFVVAYLALDFFSFATESYIKTYYVEKMSWKEYLKFGIFFMVILVGLTRLTGTSIIQVESL